MMIRPGDIKRPAVTRAELPKWVARVLFTASLFLLAATTGCQGEPSEQEQAIDSLVQIGARIDFSESGQPIFVNLSETKVTEGHLKLLTQFDSIEKLWLYKTTVDDASLESIGKLKSLRILVLDHTQITDAGLANLSGLSHLNELYLEDSYVSDQGVSQLNQMLPDAIIAH